MNEKADFSPQLILFSQVAENYGKQANLSAPDQDVSLSELWRLLATRLDVEDHRLATMVAELAGLESNPDLKTPDPALVAKVPYNIANSFGLLPFAREDSTVLIAISNPFDDAMHELIAFIFGINTRCVVAPPATLDVAIAEAYEKQSGEKESSEILLDELRAESHIDRQVPRLARQLLKKSLEKGASDLHIQDFVGGSAVRIRVDGMLQRLVILPNPVARGLIRYFKALGSMDPTSSIRPQDGRVSVRLENADYDLRLSVIPTQGKKEKLVIRFLSRNQIFNLSPKNFSLEEIHTLRRLASSPSGVVLICGPTGSGKTTTLYSILSELNDEKISISTVENPVEYNMAGLAQTEVNEKAGMTFASALRSILRQDPDVILIGEIRDSETAQIAMQSALTGHLVFSTLHTNDALSAIPRLQDLGVPSAILTEALVGLVSQRLLRRLCHHCKIPANDGFTQIEEAFHSVSHTRPAYRVNGCAYCHYTGYSGRVVVSEMFEIGRDLRSLIQKGEADIEKLHKAIGEHQQNLSISASRLIVSGETTVEEAVRVIGRHFWFDLAEEYKTGMPSLSVLNLVGDQLQSSSGQAILLAGSEHLYSEGFRENLEKAWFEPHLGSSPDLAKSALQQFEDIGFVILALEPNKSAQEYLDYVAAYRRALAWSRLPALIWLPENAEGLQEKLIADGATSRFIPFDTSVVDIVELINEAISENMDFSWGISQDITEPAAH